MNASPHQVPQIPLFRIMFGNATLLSVVYLMAGVAVETLRRFWPSNWIYRAAIVLDSLPARTLDLVGLMEPLRAGNAYGHISDWVLRLIFSGTTIAIIFLMALIVGAGMWLLRRFLYRRYMEL